MGRRARAMAAGHIPSRPNVARVYGYLLGGRDHFSADRAYGQQVIDAVPHVRSGARAQRAVLLRAVRYLVANAGVRQLLEIGTGMPTRENVHQVAQRIDPSTRVVYVDNDPVVLAHANAVLADNAATAVAEGDLRDPAGILAHPVVSSHLDWNEPVGLLLCGVLHQITDDDRPADLTATLIGALAPGSYVFIQHLLDLDDPVAVRLKQSMTQAFGRIKFRTFDQVRSLFCGLELVDPGLVPVPDWRPGDDATAADDDGGRLPVLGLACAGLARKS